MPISVINDYVSNDLLLWKLSEKEIQLNNLVNLSLSSKSRLDLIKSSSQRKQFLGIQNLLSLHNINNEVLFYDDNGKPHLLNNKFISISHSFDYCGVIVSDVKVGIDIEKFRSKILNISKKFVSESDLALIKVSSVENITKVWSIKEAVYKAFGHNKIDFKKNIIIKSVNKEFNKATVLIFNNEISENYSIEIYNFSQYICCIAKQID
ncbi:MAG: 4'-phosphopantetheinyl transferase superfamily protein [Flavobacteriaceae bacterium]|jgi:phosphopantetheinyl transferase|nr:4'-phosphopantetheinyl transferase superfamily protein [Flavobacteriaceae bacterium]MBT5232646.1 4'-phosphopantetheinyl transferase superfamily protein [Flavobacteriaceae bacterium]MDA7566563.1 4'-phosphopantetheinyl transferase superfamily protein [Flavobacteriaceae bacterium]MDA8807598.1 4'-phosphopantetheinyl transferase superfamily protein [Flavobacteriaceae bacterium]MDB4601011.1 4'-phosphopantetheinyl transferase superfamily protein [Flavobacteriaceae bacterium]|tara:strand:+ start:42 stop:665 length:624 start_codon:yes stop_codon:yes gene_type:complete